MRRMSRKLGSLPIDALSSFPTEAVFNQRWERSLYRTRQTNATLASLVLELAGSDHLEHCAQNATVIDHAIEYSVHQLRIANRQRDQQCCRHVLHERLLTSVQSQLRQVLVIRRLRRSTSDFVKLRLGRAVERVAERTRSRNLSQSVLRLELVRAATRFVDCVRSRQSLERLANRDLLAIV